MAGGTAGLVSLEASRSRNSPPAKTSVDSVDHCQRDVLRCRHFTLVTGKPPTSYRMPRTCGVPIDLILHILQLDCEQVAVVAVYLRCDKTSRLCMGQVGRSVGLFRHLHKFLRFLLSTEDLPWR